MEIWDYSFLRKYSLNFIDVLVKIYKDDIEWRFTGLYGSSFADNRADTWRVLKEMSVLNNYPCLVCGDFNKILRASKKSRGLPREGKHMEMFREALDFCNLFDVGFSGRWFTWK